MSSPLTPSAVENKVTSKSEQSESTDKLRKETGVGDLSEVCGFKNWLFIYGLCLA